MLYMKSHAIRHSQMIEIGLEGLNSRFEPCTPLLLINTSKGACVFSIHTQDASEALNLIFQLSVLVWRYKKSDICHQKNLRPRLASLGFGRNNSYVSYIL